MRGRKGVVGFQAYWSSFSCSAALTVRFEIRFPALAARLAFLCSSLDATMRFPVVAHDLEYKSLLGAPDDIESDDFIIDLYTFDPDPLRCLFVGRFQIYLFFVRLHTCLASLRSPNYKILNPPLGDSPMVIALSSFAFGISLSPLISLIAGILILIMPRLLNFIVAIYLIIIGLVGVFNL